MNILLAIITFTAQVSFWTLLGLLGFLVCLLSVLLLHQYFKLKLIKRSFSSSARTFRPIYTKRESLRNAADINICARLQPNLEPFGMKLLPSIDFIDFVKVKDEVHLTERASTYSELDGRKVLFLLIESANLTPLAVVVIGEGVPRVEMLEVLQDTIDFTRSLYDSIGLPEIVVSERDLENLERVASRMDEIVKEGQVGVSNV